MTFDQAAISAILVCTLVLFVWGRWRYDVVAMLSLMTAVGFGVVDPAAAFAGLGNAAVVTVAAVLAISHALGRSGVVDLVRSEERRVGKEWVRTCRSRWL